MYFFFKKNTRLNVFFFLKKHFRKLKRTKFERCESDFFRRNKLQRGNFFAINQ